MILSRAELLSSVKHEVHILQHLASKVDRTKLDYRPTAKQRSTLELLKYLSMMGPTLVRYVKVNTPDPAMWVDAAAAADARDFDQTITAIAAHGDLYASLLADVSDADLRAEVMGMDGSKTSRGSVLVNGVLCSCAAYRTQLFLYIKACGRDELNTMNLWAGVDSPAA